ncbi:MAG: DEAD/DEAH box helicase family protein [Candidatus Pacearchaeota archaeon]
MAVRINKINERIFSLDLSGIDSSSKQSLIYRFSNEVSFVYKKLNVLFNRSKRRTETKIEAEKINLFFPVDNDCNKIVFFSGHINKIIKILKDQNIEFDDVDNVLKVEKIDYDISELRKRSIILKPNQDVCISRIASNKNGLIIAPTGMGKSMIIAMCCLLFKNKRIDVINQSISVCEMLGDLISRVTGEKVGRIGGWSSKGRINKKRINVVTSRSMIKSGFDADIVFLDEVHQLVTRSNFENILKYKNARIYGLTASLEREDNLHHYAYSICGDVIFNISYEECRALGIIPEINVLWMRVKNFDLEQKREYGFVERKRVNVWNNDYRNKLIADIANKFVESGNQVLIMVETIEHCYNIKKFLPNFEVCYADSPKKYSLINKVKKMGLSYENMTKTKRIEIAKKFENREIMGVIANGVWSTGVSFNSLNVLIRASGTSSSIKSVQEPGRVCRIDEKTNKYVGLVVDFVDEFDNNLLKKSHERFKVYKELGFTQIDIEKMKIVENFKDF